MGRPPIGRMVNVRIPADVLVELDRIAAVRNTSRAELLREAAHNLITQHKETS